jgi:phosphorylase kinase alpha/beta subunit
LESLRTQPSAVRLTWARDTGLETLETPTGGWRTWRQYRGILNRVPGDFYAGVWRLFEHTHGLIIGEKLERRNRLDSRVVLSDMTPGEKAFAMRIEHLLNKIPAPEYRHLNLEALTVLSSFTEQNPTLRIEDYLVMDVLIGHAVRLAFVERYPDQEAGYSEHKATAWSLFYELPPVTTSDCMIRALRYLLDYGADERAEPALQLG